MGNIQCISNGRGSISWDIIEKSLKNINTPLDKKVHDEYYSLKREYKDKKSVINKLKIENFVKWYKMAHITFDNTNSKFVWLPKSGASAKSNDAKSNDTPLSYMEINLNLGGSNLNYSDIENNIQVCAKNKSNYTNNISSIANSSENNESSLSFSCGNDNAYESNLRNYKFNHSNEYLKQMLKGTPDSLKWVSWVVSADLPANRSIKIYNDLYNQKIDERVDSEIKKDLYRTMVDILSYKSEESDDQPLNFLYRVLRVYSSIDKEVSYCQGMNFIVGFLLICSDFNETDTLYMLVAILSNTYSKKFGIRGFFIEDFPLLKFYCYLFNHFFAVKMPELKKHFQKLDLPDEVWICKWIQTVYTISLPFEYATRLWDCLISYGMEFLILFSLAFVSQYELKLLSFEDSFDVINFFKKVFTSKEQNEIKILNMEDVIYNAKKLDIYINKQSIFQVRKEFEKIYKIDLNLYDKEYELNSPQIIQPIEFNLFGTSSHTGTDIITNTSITNEIDNELEDCDGNNEDIEEDININKLSNNLYTHTMTANIKFDNDYSKIK